MSEPEYRALARSAPHFGPALKAGGYPMAGIKHFDDLPRGAIVATCRLVDCRRIEWVVPLERGRSSGLALLSGNDYAVYPLPDEPERAFGDYSPGRFAWLLTDIRALPEPIPARGALGLWEYEGELQ